MGGWEGRKEGGRKGGRARVEEKEEAQARGRMPIPDPSCWKTNLEKLERRSTDRSTLLEKCSMMMKARGHFPARGPLTCHRSAADTDGPGGSRAGRPAEPSSACACIHACIHA